MRRTSTASWAAIALAVALLLVAAACGGTSSSSASSSPAPAVPAGVSADQVVKDSEAAMAAVTSAAFVMDAGMTVQGDTSKMTDPTTKALLADGVTVHADGKSQTDPTAADMTITLGIAGQNLELGMKTQGAKSWVGYQGQWYKVDAKNGKSLDKQAGIGADPTAQLKSLGLDPSTWGLEYTMVGEETVSGVKTYHVKGTADPAKLAAALLKASEDPKLAQKLGGSAQLKGLEQSLGQDKSQIEQLSKGLKEATVDYWIGVDDSLIYKMQMAGALDTTGQKGMSGVDGMSMKLAVSMSGFNQPVTVTPPADAQSLDQLMQQMFGGLGASLGAGVSY
jgi:hypothetical protein